jgi:hypothetical protein
MRWKRLLLPITFSGMLPSLVASEKNQCCQGEFDASVLAFPFSGLSLIILSYDQIH